MRFLPLAAAVIAAISLLSQLVASVPANSELTLSDVRLGKRAQTHPRMGYSKKVRGVNLGGWFVLEAWMQPDFFTSDLVTKGAIDQWTWMQAVGDNTKALTLLKQHWSSWITQSDFAQIKAAGLNTVRIPVGHWAFNASSSEPYLGYAEQPYISQALLWAKQYGLDVMLDLHTAPNSQNGFDNSGHQGAINFASVNATQNAARVYSALQSMVKLYVNDAKYGGVVKGVEILNEPTCWSFGQSYITKIYKAAYTAIRNTVSSSASVLPTTIVHDCFVQPLSGWYSTYSDTSFWKTGSLSMDTHRYQAWAPQNTYTFDQHISYTCGLQSELSAAQTHQPVITGEWSLAIGCTNCTFSDMPSNINAMNNQTQNLFFRRFFEAQVTTYEKAGGWIFWNWKTQSRGDWSYQAALAQGWIPKDPTTRVFKQVNGCPTSTLLTNVTFATTSYPQAANTTTTTTSSTTKASALSGSSTGLVTSTTKGSSSTTTSSSSSHSTSTKRSLIDQIIPLIPSTGKRIDTNVFPFIKKTTFAFGPSH